MSIQKDYESRCAVPSDINELMPVLYDYATQSNVVVEFGVRTGNSTAAFLAGLEKSDGFLYSYDIKQPQCGFDSGWWEFTQADTGKLDAIPECDTLFIDTLHTAAQVEAELRQAKYVRKWILLHDTMLFGDKGEGQGGGFGITHAIYCFLRDNHGAWRIKDHLPHNNGLLILERL